MIDGGGNMPPLALDDINYSRAAWFEPIVVLRRQNLRVAHTARIDSFVKLECGDGMLIGEFVHVASFCHLGIGGGRVIFEDGSSAGSGTRVISGSNVPGIGHGCSAVAPDAVFEKSFVRICKNATLFAGVTVLPGVTIGEGAAIAAGAVVNRDVPAGELWGGVPARFLKKIGGEAAHILVKETREEILDRWIAAQNEFYGR